jgi:hypothetical protein
LIPNPIHKVLSTLRKHEVRFLLMGGQACVFYGAAEFSRDTDIMLLLESGNLDRLKKALDELQAVCVAVPPFEVGYLKRRHAVRFRCLHPEAEKVRIDVLSCLRGVDPFEELWQRRTTIETETAEVYELVSLPDLVTTKKTQQDKDWPMIRRLVEAHFVRHRDRPADQQVRFWLEECRTPDMLIELACSYPQMLDEVVKKRELLAHAARGEKDKIEAALKEEEDREREADRKYWRPLKEELERLRHGKC